MAHSKSAKKRVRQNHERRLRNRSHRSRLRTQAKGLRQAIAAGDADATRAALPVTAALLDRMAGRGVLHRNAAARAKSRLTRAANVVMGVALALSLGAGLALAHNPRGEAKASFSGKAVSVDYGRPSLNGRDMLGMATPGMIWRLGSEGATTITSEGSLMFGSEMLPAGAYTLFAKKTDAGWDLVVNKETGQMGNAHDPGHDVLSMPMKVETRDSSEEMFTISLMADGMNGQMTMQWGTTALVADLMVH